MPNDQAQYRTPIRAGFALQPQHVGPDVETSQALLGHSCHYDLIRGQQRLDRGPHCRDVAAGQHDPPHRGLQPLGQVRRAGRHHRLDVESVWQRRPEASPRLRHIKFGGGGDLQVLRPLAAPVGTALAYEMRDAD